MITIDTIYTIFTPLLGIGSVAFTVSAFIGENLSTPVSIGSDVSPMAIIISLIGTFVLGLMRITNSVKNVEETNNKILTVQNQILDSQNKLLQVLVDDSKKQDKLLENQLKLVDLENKSLDAGNKTLAAMTKWANTKNQNTKKPGGSGTYPVDRRNS